MAKKTAGKKKGVKKGPRAAKRAVRTTRAAAGNQLPRLNCIVQLMLENRSFDQMLGFLYQDSNNVSPLTGQPFEGLTGNETNPDPRNRLVKVFPIGTPNPDVPAAVGRPYFIPGCDPGEQFQDVNDQLFGQDPAPASPPTNQGFVQNFAISIKAHSPNETLPDTVPAEIMGMYPPDMLPVISGLAKGFAVCDQWFASVPTQTFPNRAFANAGTSLGVLKDHDGQVFNCPSIFGKLSDANLDWAIYGYNAPPLTRTDFPDTKIADPSHFGEFADFKSRAAAGNLPPYTFLEPGWGPNGNSQHPNYNVAVGEQLMLDVYRALQSSPQWQETLLIITYDEHGGNFDHVSPPSGAVPPDQHVGESEGFDFSRFGVRVPAVLISPWIPQGTVFRATSGTIDHTSVLKTIEEQWGLAALTQRDAAAPSLAGVLSLNAPRDDDPMENVSAPVAGPGPRPDPQLPSHIQLMQATRVADLPIPDKNGFHSMPEQPDLSTSSKIRKYIKARMRKWDAYLAKNGRGAILRKRLTAARQKLR